MARDRRDDARAEADPLRAGGAEGQRHVHVAAEGLGVRDAEELEAGGLRRPRPTHHILRGAGSGDTIKRIAVGQGDAGSADFSAITGARANEDIKVKAIAAYFRRPPHSIFVREGTGINSAKDLAGKTLAITPGNSHQTLFPLLAQLAGFNPDSVKWV